MDWTAFRLSAQLGIATALILLPLSVWAGRLLAHRTFPGKVLIEAAVALPLVLPPTVLGYYLLVAFGGESAVGRAWQALVGRPLVFTFEGLVLASVIFNIPFAVHPVQRAFEAIPPEIRHAAACCGMTPWTAFLKIELPLAWPGIVTGAVLSFAHTLGEFGIVLMVGGSIPGETRTVAVAIYDRVQAFDTAAAGQMALLLVAVSGAVMALSLQMSRRIGRRLG